MSEVFKKLNLKDQSEILVINAPASFEPDLEKLTQVKVLRTTAKARSTAFAIAFVTQQSELDSVSKELTQRAEGDAILWIAYPKGTSKRYNCEFNRDSGWEALRAAGFDTVRQVAIDEDWSALRFRRTQFINPKS